MRLFLALELGQELQKEMARLQRPLKKAAPYGLAFTRNGQHHITFKFLKDVSDENIPAIIEMMDEVAAETPPFVMTLAQSGYFPAHGRLRVIWVTIEDEPEGIALRCQQVFDERLEALGHPREIKPYLPHITIARVKRSNPNHDVRGLVAKLLPLPLKQEVRSFSLFQSELTIRGAIHTKLHEAALSGKS